MKKKKKEEEPFNGTCRLLCMKNHTANMAWFSIESSYTKGSLQVNCKLEHSYYIPILLCTTEINLMAFHSYFEHNSKTELSQ